MKVYLIDFYEAVTGRKVGTAQVVNACRRWSVPTIDISKEGSKIKTLKVDVDDTTIARCKELWVAENAPKPGAAKGLTAMERIVLLEDANTRLEATVATLVTGYTAMSHIVEGLRAKTK